MCFESCCREPFFSLPNYPLNHLSLYYNVVEYIADFKSIFEGDNWVKKLHFKLGDTRGPISCVFGIEIGL